MNQLQSRIEEVVITHLSKGRTKKPSKPNALDGLFIPSWQMPTALSPVEEPPPIESSMSFMDISLCFYEPLAICIELEDSLDLPSIPWQHRSLIPTTEEMQDYVRLSDGRADIDLTIAVFAERIADWLERRHLLVAQRLSLVN